MENDDALEANGPPTEGGGLSNLRVRLQTLYGSEASLVVGPTPEGRFRVSLALPVEPSRSPAVARV